MENSNVSRDELGEQLRDRLTGPILSRLRQAVALHLWESRAIRVSADEPFRLASGNSSPIYIDCRRVVSNPSFMRLYNATAAMMLERKGARFDVVAGGETAGIPYGAYLASALSAPFIYIRKQPKAYGTGSRVEGELKPGARVLLVEDLITDGGSKLGFLDAVKEVGGEITDALVLFDRQQGGGDLLAGRNVALHSVCDRTTAFAAGHSAALLSDGERSSCDDYFRDPKAWHQLRGLSYEEP